MSVDTLTDVIWPFTTPFYSGGGSAVAGVPLRWDVAINGHQYMIDTDPDQWRTGSLLSNQSIQALRTQADQGKNPSEETLTRDDFWRRTFTSYHHGAGQRWADRSQSDSFRFRASKGVNPWTQDRLTLLPDVTQVVASATITEAVVINGGGFAGQIVYMDNGAPKIAYINTDDSLNAGFSGAVTGLPGNHPGLFNTLASDGSACYIITGPATADRVYKASGGGSLSAVAFSDTFGPDLRCIGVAHGRILVGYYSSGAKIADITTGTHVAVGNLQDLGEQVVGFAEGSTVIYATSKGAQGHQSRIYSITYDPTTATLGTPKVAGLIPVGETPQVIYGYLGFLFIGTDRGFRMAAQATDGSLSIGAVVTTPGKVSAFTAIGQYVYFTWSSFDASSSGIGRIDITVFTDTNVPAYASDLMAPVSGPVTALCELDNGNTSYSGPRPYFAVQAVSGGLYQQHATNLAPSGTLDTGLIGYGFPESKDATYIDVRHEPLVGTVAASLASDEAAFTTIDVSTVQGSAGFFMKAGHKPASRHELRATLTRQTTTTGPALTELSVNVYPAIQRGDVWQVPLLIPDEALLLDNSGDYYDFWAEYAYIKGLAASRTPSTFQIGSQVFTVYVDDYRMISMRRAENNPGGWWGNFVVMLKNLERVIAQ